MGTIYQKVGENIKKYRKVQRLSQEELALMAKLDPKSIVKIEIGERNPTLKTIKKIASVLKVKPAELFE